MGKGVDLCSGMGDSARRVDLIDAPIGTITDGNLRNTHKTALCEIVVTPVHAGEWYIAQMHC